MSTSIFSFRRDRKLVKHITTFTKPVSDFVDYQASRSKPNPIVCHLLVSLERLLGQRLAKFGPRWWFQANVFHSSEMACSHLFKSLWTYSCQAVSALARSTFHPLVRIRPCHASMFQLIYFFHATDNHVSMLRFLRTSNDARNLILRLTCPRSGKRKESFYRYSRIPDGWNQLISISNRTILT